MSLLLQPAPKSAIPRSSSWNGLTPVPALPNSGAISAGPWPSFTRFPPLPKANPCLPSAQIRIARTRGLPDETARRHFQRLYQDLPAIFPPEPPALLHGDLWSGSFLCDTNGMPVLIDPAVYFGQTYYTNILHTIERF
ncbi:MAG TPA: fructosamine kinase family protein [Puia sp.]